MSERTIPAIETSYAGCRFRSRLEARWAVFFDALGVAWEYEPQGYLVGPYEKKRAYLPDFWLPDTSTWVEVKGAAENLDWTALLDATDWDCGLPYTHWSVGGTSGLLLLGPIPRIDPGQPQPGHPILQHDKGVRCGIWEFRLDGATVTHPAEYWVDEVPRQGGGIARDLSSWYGDSTCDGGDGLTPDMRRLFAGQVYALPLREPGELVRWAYRAARSARFEHGESPQPVPTRGET